MKTASIGLISIAALFCLNVARAGAGSPAPFPQDALLPAEDADNRLPKLIERVEAVYPPEAMPQKLEDEVWVAFIVDQKGEVTNVRAFFSRYPIFEQPAVDAVRRWKFQPGRHQGHFVKTRMVVPIGFKAPGTPAPPPS